MKMRELDFVVFEGINGCGKGTHLSRFEDFVYDSGREVLVSRVRTPNELDENGKLAREMLKAEGDPYENGMRAVEYFGKNHKTTARHIATLNEMGHKVIGDRNYLSTFAFQHAQGISYEDIAKGISGFMIPDLTFLIDVPAGVAFDRLHGRDGENRRKFDSNVDFMEKVRSNYLELPEILPGLIGDKSIVVVDGDRSVEDVFEEIKSFYNAFLKVRNP